MPRSRAAALDAPLPFDEPLSEDDAYLTRQLITYIGNKRALLGPIRSAVEDVCRRLDKPRIRTLDGFAGAGVTSRLFKKYSSELIVNDIEAYAAVVGRCYLTNPSAFPREVIQAEVARLNRVVSDTPTQHGFIERLYAPADEENITRDDRVFYTRANACRLDSYRQLIEDCAPEHRDWLLGPLLSQASIHANTAGVFKGFYKDSSTGRGRYGGSGADALDRIKRKIHLEAPILSSYESTVHVHQEDTNALVRGVGDLDLAYFDPPYNQHPYGSNYFMLNLLTRWEEPQEISKVSGIPVDWTRSGYNVKSRSLPLLQDLVENTDSRFILLSYNDEGFVTIDDMRAMLRSYGKIEEVQTQYATFRGSRNLRNRSISVTEHLFLLEKRGS